MHNEKNLRMLCAIVSGAAALLISVPVQAQQAVTVEGTYKVSGNNNDASAYFTRAKSADKATSIGNTKLIAVMSKLSGQGAPPTTDLNYVLVGNPERPDGGLFVRFPGLTLPSLDLNFPPAVPDASTKFDFFNGNTKVYSVEYNSFNDFPKYPLGVLDELDYITRGVEFIVNFPDISVPQSAKFTRVHVKFSLKKPGALALGNSGLSLPGKTVFTKNKIDLSQN